MVSRALFRGCGSGSTVTSLLTDDSRLDGPRGVVGRSGNKSCRLLAMSMRCNEKKQLTCAHGGHGKKTGSGEMHVVGCVG